MESFEVENFRSLKHLKLEKLARVNLLVGKNNSGKTSALEALFALNGIKDVRWLTVTEAQRSIGGETADFRHLFYGFDDRAKITLDATYYDDGGKKIAFLPLNVTLVLLRHSTPIRTEIDINSKELRPTTSRKTVASTSLVVTVLTMGSTQSFDFDIGRSQTLYFSVGFESTIAWNILNSDLDPDNLSRSPVEMLTTNIDRQILGYKIEILKFNKKGGQLLQIMQQIDSRINSIELGSGGQIYLDLGEAFRTLLPLTLMGEGIQRLLDIVLSMSTMAGAVILIDEIDNGLHYSALRILWKGILQAAREYDVQVFATTHSAEALRHLTWVLDDEEYKDYRDDVAAYTLIRADDDTVRSYRHDYEQLDYALDHGLEIRN